MWGFHSSRTVVIAIAGAAFLVCSVFPLAYMLASALVGPGAGGSEAGITDAWAALLLDPRQRTLLWNSACLGVATAFVSTLLGAPLGIAFARVDLRFKRTWRTLLTAPLLLPPYVMALAWIYAGDSTGVLARIVGRDLSSAWTSSLPGAVLVLSAVFFPLSMLATEAAVRRIDARLEEAALLVTSPGRVLWHITLPLAAPGVWAAALAIFVLAISEFGVPSLLRVRVYTTEVFTAFAALYDFSRATVLTIPLLLVAIIVAVTAAALEGDRLVAPRRRVGAGPVIPLDAWRRPATIVMGGVLTLCLVVPVATLAREALAGGAPMTIAHGSRNAITNSLLLATVSATVIVALAVWLGYARARASRRWGRSADALFVVLFATPSTVTGIALIGLWNRPGPLGALYGTDAMLLLASLARFLPVAALVLGASVRQVPASHEEAATVSGAGWLRTMTHIVLPQITPGLLAAWTIAFVLAFGELGASILVVPPGEATLPIRIYTLISNTPPSHVAALALLQAAVVFVPLVVLGLLLATRERR